MGNSGRGAGVLLSVRWGDQSLAHEYFPLGSPRTFTIGTGPRCDLACGGAKAFQLLEVDEEGAALSAPKGAKVQVTRRSECWTTQGEAVALERGDHAGFDFGPLTFEARVLDAPPSVQRGATFDFTTVNLGLLLAAAFGFFAVAAANRDAEGSDLDDGLSGGSTRVLKILNDVSARQASASAAAPHPQKTKPTPSSPPKARLAPVSRPTGRPSAQAAVDVGSIFHGPGALKLISGGGGQDLLAAANGLRTAQAGDGYGGLGAGHAPDGHGLGGLALEGIGRLGTHGHAGGDNKYGVGMQLAPKDKPDPTIPIDVEENCSKDGAGCLDKELVRRVIHQNLPGFRYCYESLLNRFPSLEGKVSVRFSISQSGKVPDASVGQTTVHNAELEQCVANRARLLVFPARKWAGLVVVTYPFIFHTAGK